MIRSMTLGGVEIPLLATYDLRTQFLPNVRQTIYPMGDGSTAKQTLQGSLGKLRVVISGRGSVPPGLDLVDFSGSVLFQSGSERSARLAGTSITLPTARRADAGYTPWGRASVSGNFVETPVVMTGDQADLTPVTGADFYQVLWYPEFQVDVEGGGPVIEDDARDAETAWQLSLIQK